MKERDYRSCVEDIIEHMNYAEEFIKYMTFEEFANDKRTILSVTKWYVFSYSALALAFVDYQVPVETK